VAEALSYHNEKLFVKTRTRAMVFAVNTICVNHWNLWQSYATLILN